MSGNFARRRILRTGMILLLSVIALSGCGQGKNNHGKKQHGNEIVSIIGQGQQQQETLGTDIRRDIQTEAETILDMPRIQVWDDGAVCQENVNSVLQQIISDYLEMDADEFEGKYSKEELYAEGILYCGREAWKYNGEQLDAFQSPQDYYDIEDITAIRIIKEQQNAVYNGRNISERCTPEEQEGIAIEHQGDYAVSIYNKVTEDDMLCVKEISFIKIELGTGAAPKTLYKYIEDDYYKVREEIESAAWMTSPDGSKEACVSNGELPKHPSQIFIRDTDKDMPDIVFRRSWEHRIVGWIDDNHLICDVIDVSMPILIHLERNAIEQISGGENEYDTYGAEYELKDGYLIAKCMDNQIYSWKIVKEKEEFYLESAE